MRLFALLAGLLLAVPAAASTKLIVALDPTYPPMESEADDGTLAGFDIDVAKELGKRLGRKTEFMVMGWEGILGGLVARRYDVIISSMNVTPDRQKQIDFVEYARMSQLFVAKPGIAITDPAQLAGKTVAVATDTTSAEYLAKLEKTVKLKAVKAFRLTSEVFMAVKSGHADLLVVDEPVGRHYVKVDPTEFQVAGRAMAPEPIGIGIRKTDAALKAEIQKAVDAMRADGTLKKMAESHFGSELGS